MSFTPGSSLKIDELPHDVAFPFDIAVTFFNNLSPYIRDLLISEGVQVLPRPPTEKNHQWNQRLLLVRNAAVEAENNIWTINKQYNQWAESATLKNAW